jgi:hypothetical protein
MGRVANAAHEKQPANGFQLQGACPEVLGLYLNILSIRQRLRCALRDGDSADAIESHCQELLSEMVRIEGAASREARTRGWDLKEIEYLVQGMLPIAECRLQEADSKLYKRKAAHHAARVEVLAGKASEVLDGTRRWSRRHCTEFWEELNWELQAFSKTKAELELPDTPIDKRQAAHLRREEVGAAAHHARQVEERVLWHHDYGWEEPQRLGLDHHQPSRPEESCEQGGRRGVQAGSVADGGGGPQRVVRTEDKIGSLRRWTWCPLWQAWASKPADLARHWLGETEDAPEELLRTIQEPGEEAGRP